MTDYFVFLNTKERWENDLAEMVKFSVDHMTKGICYYGRDDAKNIIFVGTPEIHKDLLYQFGNVVEMNKDTLTLEYDFNRDMDDHK